MIVSHLSNPEPSVGLAARCDESGLHPFLEPVDWYARRASVWLHRWRQRAAHPRHRPNDGPFTRDAGIRTN